MANNIAIVTQSYKADYYNCKLLCESIDRFAPDIRHFIFVNDEDILLFQSLAYKKHVVFKKSIILPWYLFRLPWKLMGHHFHVSVFTIPVREWIIQQICKLGVFEVIGSEYDAVLNIDSETVLMKPFSKSDVYKDGKYMLFRRINLDEPSHEEYCDAIENLLKVDVSQLPNLRKYNYMNTPFCFTRENVELLLNKIKENSLIKSWKNKLCNTYRFSEYYTYAVFTDQILRMRNHYYTEIHMFPQIDTTLCKDINDFKRQMDEILLHDEVKGLWLQKRERKALANNYLDIQQVSNVIHEYWKDNK